MRRLIEMVRRVEKRRARITVAEVDEARAQADEDRADRVARRLGDRRIGEPRGQASHHAHAMFAGPPDEFAQHRGPIARRDRGRCFVIRRHRRQSRGIDGTQSRGVADMIAPGIRRAQSGLTRILEA